VTTVQACALALVLLAGSPPWQPEGKPPHEGDVGNRLRLHADLEALHWIGSITYPGAGGTTQIRHEQVGAFGYKRFALGGGLGWGITDWLVVGGRFDLSVFPDRAGPGSRAMSRGGSFSPYAELLFLRQRHVRPFLLARVGVGWMSTFGYADGSYSSRPTHAFVPSIGVGLGTHAFINEDLSFDVALTLDHRWNMRPRGSSFEEGFAVKDSKLIAGLVVGFSRWF
jgi:hypothetical protein